MPPADYLTKPMMNISWGDFDSLHETLSSQLGPLVTDSPSFTEARGRARDALINTFDPSLTAPGWLVAAGVHLNVSTDHVVANLVIPL